MGISGKMITIKSDREIGYMSDAGRIVAETHREVAKHVAEGITTLELDRVAEEYITRKGAVPAFKGYNGFPASVCTSINEEVVHGIPSLRQLNNGDIISIDIGVLSNGFFGDAAQTLPVGEVSLPVLNLLKVTAECLQDAIDQVQVGKRLGDVSHAVESHAVRNGFSVVHDYVGHGIGTKLHEEPQVPNFGHPARGLRLRAGMVLAIEPMVNMGGFRVKTLQDNWTVVTEDGLPSAHFEHTVAVTENGPQILTRL